MPGRTLKPASGVFPPAALCASAFGQATGVLTSRDKNIPRAVATGSDGAYSAPSLQPGNDEVKAELQGFRTVVRPAEVLAGTPASVNAILTVGASTEVANLEAAAAQISYDNNTIAGVIQVRRAMTFRFRATYSSASG